MTPAIRLPLIFGLSALSLVACQKVPPVVVAPIGTIEMISSQKTEPAKKRPGQCWGQDSTPAVVETVRERVLVRPARNVAVAAPDGAPTYRTVKHEAVYKTVTRQKIIKPRREFWFQVPCAEALTPDFFASLQRALKSRGLFQGAPSGKMDRKTKKAVRRYQKEHGLDSAILSLEAARQLGLVAYFSPTD
ncbi:MAG: hypothetical protein CSA68_03890 [Rhodobacterales bacterium]|nr:MAG: hypothetical protein CSA68_03890 [Rhodobacterales bacterium]